MEYTEFSVQGKPSIGMMPMNEHMPAHVPSYWMPYFQVDDADASVAKAKELGGSVMVPPTDIPKTRSLRDRQRSAGRDVRGVQVRAELT